ncbi:MAG: cytochrome c maturation protein CcmE [FCB group bacterium]|nr:cytochrome c maturation protein CcmE [FCB group bacterium]
MASKNKFLFAIIGVVAVVVFWIYWVSVSSSADNPTLVRYLSIEELKDQNQTSRVKLGGIVKDGSIVISDSDLLDVTFLLEQGGETLPVRYYGTRPDLFKDGVEVILEGRYEDGIFIADQLQTKCASRYEGDLREENNSQSGEL